MISRWLFFPPQHPAALKIFFPCTSSAASSWGSYLESTISQHRPLARIISGRYYASDVLCESGLLDSRSLLAGAQDKSHLRDMKNHTCTVKKKKKNHSLPSEVPLTRNEWQVCLSLKWTKQSSLFLTGDIFLFTFGSPHTFTLIHRRSL